MVVPTAFSEEPNPLASLYYREMVEYQKQNQLLVKALCECHSAMENAGVAIPVHHQWVRRQIGREFVRVIKGK